MSRRPPSIDRSARACAVVSGIWLVTIALISDRSAAGRLAMALVMVAIAGVAIRALGSRSTSVRAWASLGLGLVTVASAAAVGLPWLAVAGASAVVAIAGAALVAGVVLVGVGAWLAIRETPGRWRLLAIPVAFLLLQLGVLPLAGAFYGTHPPRAPMRAAVPDGTVAVTDPGPDGGRLAAWYTPSRTGAAVILLPGSGGDRTSTLEHARVLSRHGFGVLALDSRGTGESAGVGNAWGWHGTGDIIGALDWLEQRPEVDPGRIAAVGLSMGGEEALTAAAVEPRVAAVVAEGASGRTAEDLAYLPLDVAGVIQRLEGVVMFGVADLMTDADPPIALRQAVAAAQVPILLIVGSAEDERLAAPGLEAASGWVERWDVPDAPHIGALATHPEAWERRVVGFLAAALRVSEPGAPQAPG